MDVAAYIKQLLYSRQNVYVPGLGTFSTLKTAGTYSPSQHLFYPPKNSIGFIEEEIADEKTLEKYISLQKNISPQAAKYFIEKFVDQLKYDSAAINIPVNEVLFPPEDEVAPQNLKPDPAVNQENFGLPPISLIKINPQSAADDEDVVTKKDYVENFYREFSKNLADENPEVQPKKSTGLWAAAAALLIICFAGIYFLYIYHPDLFSRFRPQNQSASTIVAVPTDSAKQVPVVEKPMVKDTVSTKTIVNQPVADTTIKPKITVVKAAATAKPEKEVLTSVPAATSDPDVVEKSPYEIIGAAFKTVKGAKTFLSQLKSKGMHRAKILANDRPGKQNLITFGSFQDKASAEDALEKLRAKDVHSEAYIQHYQK